MKWKCVDSYVRAGLTMDMAKRLCANTPDHTSKSGPTPKLKEPLPRKDSYGLVPVGKVTSSFRESSSMGRGWNFRTGHTGSGAVVFPDSDAAAKAFLKSLGRPLTDADSAGWRAYADRIGMPPEAADRAWKLLNKKELRPKLNAVETLERIFEATSWWGYSAPHALQFKPQHGGPSKPTPKMAKEPKKVKSPIGHFAAPPPSFPFHTNSTAKVYEKALKLVTQYPLEGPADILKRAISGAGATPITDITPEDEKLLVMAIEIAQNGPPPSNIRIGGMPGGPFNSTQPAS